MLRGGMRISEHFGQHPRLDLVASEIHGIYVNSLFRARMDATSYLPTQR
jgi:hypothetical protein